MAGQDRTGQNRTSWQARLIASPIYRRDRAVKYSSTVHAEQAGEAEGLRQPKPCGFFLGGGRRGGTSYGIGW